MATFEFTQEEMITVLRESETFQGIVARAYFPDALGEFVRNQTAGCCDKISAIKKLRSLGNLSAYGFSEDVICKAINGNDFTIYPYDDSLGLAVSKLLVEKFWH